jgi:hypothetical protein
MAICAGKVLYQGQGGISRGNLAVRQGASYSPFADLPAAPPKTVSGKVTRAHTARIATMVPKGKAWVLPLAHATLLATEKTAKSGPQNRPAVRRTLPAQRRPPSMRYQQAEE